MKVASRCDFGMQLFSKSATAPPANSNSHAVKILEHLCGRKKRSDSLHPTGVFANCITVLFTTSSDNEDINAERMNH